MSVQAYLREAAARGRRRIVAGGFEVFVDPARDSPHANYAIPLDGIEPTADDVRALIGAFAGAARMPRLEYLPATAPAAEAALLAAGFEIELRTPVMSCSAATRREVPVPPGVTLESLTPRADPNDVIALVQAQQEAFGDPVDPHPPGALPVPLAVLARAGGEVAGGGMALPIGRGTTELVGIAVLERFRRRGIAGAVTAELAAIAFEAGAGTVFLTPGDDGAQRVYARAGFTPTDVMLHLRRPARSPAAPR